MLKRRELRRQDACDHANATRTTNVGIYRVSCPDCGLLEVKDLPEQVVVTAERLAGAAR